MIEQQSSASRAPTRRRPRRSRTNRGKFGSIELRYHRGDLSPELEEGFEALCLATNRLYKQLTTEPARVVGHGLPV